MATPSLYRRYRPRRFGELKGQDHVVRALREAVRSGREGQAYLFSGPRGTGKTSSARILAKVLNCENPVDGEPCCECESCLAVERGTSYDVHELDAASNNGVDAIRDLVEKASLGTPGRHKVYILDEAHMLSPAASAALLKTLEEPPPHVVFVLATTDPQKLRDTIRSRTQHLQFHLLQPDTLAEHVRWVAADAGLEVSDEALEVVLTQGAGSARDALSALELMASTGGDVSGVVDLDEFVQAMIDRDPGAVLTAMAHAISLGRDPRALTEELVRHLRNGFLSLMAPELVPLPQARVDEIAVRSQQLGAAALVRAIERLGTALVDMRHAPDPRILVEVALVQLTHDAAGGDVAALTGRLERLEQAMKSSASGAAATGAVAASPASATVDPATGRAVLGGRARRAVPAPPAPAPAPAAAVTADDDPPQPPAASTGSSAGPAVESSSETSGAAAGGSVADVWESVVRPSLKPLVRALYHGGAFVGHEGATWQFSVPNVAHRDKCETHRAAVEAALSSAVGSPVSIALVVGGAPDLHDVHDVQGPSPAAASANGVDAASAQLADDADRDIDPDELTDAPPESVLTPIDRLAQAFPGSELVDDAD
jgi:DNA polymerase-3 subunit gamma/tau